MLTLKTSGHKPMNTEAMNSGATSSKPMRDETIIYRQAQPTDLPHAQRVLRDEYAKQGYIEPDAKQAYALARFLSLPVTTTFIAQWQQAIIGTISLIKDSAEGLPMDVLYRTEVDGLRQAGQQVAEVGQLALDSQALSQYPKLKPLVRLDILTSLFSLIFHRALELKIDTLCITINPKHERLYNFLSFESLGPLRMYAAVNGAPALAKALDLERAQKLRIKHPLVRKILGTPKPR